MLTLALFDACLQVADERNIDDGAFLDEFDRRLCDGGATKQEREIAVYSAVVCVLPARADAREARRLMGCE